MEGPPKPDFVSTMVSCVTFITSFHLKVKAA